LPVGRLNHRPPPPANGPFTVAAAPPLKIDIRQSAQR
jgi:hypothetical protein